MKILIICSKNFYPQIEEIKKQLEKQDNKVYLPNCYDDPSRESRMRDLGKEAHQKFKAKMFKRSYDIISHMDAVLVLNFDKEKDGKVYKNYIGGATFLEMYDAFRLGKEIYLYNDIPEGMLYDEIEGFAPVVIHGDISLLQEAFGCTYAEFCKLPKPDTPTYEEYPEMGPYTKKYEPNKKHTE